MYIIWFYEIRTFKRHFFARVKEIRVYLPRDLHVWRIFGPLNLSPYGCNLAMTDMNTFFSQILWIFFCPWNFYNGRFTYTANPVERYSLQTYLLKSSRHHSPLVPFSPLVLVFFYLGLSLPAATVWRAPSGYHTLGLGKILLRQSFLWKIGKIDKKFFPLCIC